MERNGLDRVQEEEVMIEEVLMEENIDSDNRRLLSDLEHTEETKPTKFEKYGKIFDFWESMRKKTERNDVLLLPLKSSGTGERKRKSHGEGASSTEELIFMKKQKFSSSALGKDDWTEPNRGILKDRLSEFGALCGDRGKQAGLETTWIMKSKHH